MKKRKSKVIFGKRSVYTLIAALVLCTVCLTAIYAVYVDSVDDNFEQMHLQAKQFKKDIRLQMESDHENLITMARIAAKMYEKGEDFNLLYESYKEIGLLSDIGVLLQDGTFVTKVGEMNIADRVSFEEEAKKGAYISGKVSDFTRPDKEIIRSCAPVTVDGEVVAILYGMTELKDIENRYKEDIEDIDAQLYVFEAERGNLIIDTVNPTLDNISILKNRKYLNGHTYEEMMNNVENNRSGNTEFVSRKTQEDLYVHYAPIGVSDWYIIVARPTRIVFSNAHRTALILFAMFIMLLLVGVLYMFLIMRSERKIARLNDNASGIRKLLLEINHENSSINDALQSINNFASSRSVIFADTDGQLFKYASPKTDRKFTEEEQEYFVKTMLEFARQNRTTSETDVRSYELTVNKNASSDSFDAFLLKHGIKSVVFTAVLDRSNHIGMIAMLSPKEKAMAKALLEKIGVCFSMAIYNRKHLKNTEFAAETDSLTGLYNRTAYKRDIKLIDERRVKNFACIYVDANELHIINNTYGHAAGDEMLKFIADTLKQEFHGDIVYRMGGDEFLVFEENTTEARVNAIVKKVKKLLSEKNYHISTGVTFRQVLLSVESAVNEAEKKMYEDKSDYYHKKGIDSSRIEYREMDHIKTGSPELDKSLEIMSQRYSGIYSVDINTDKARRLLMPSYLGYNETENHFTQIFTRYVKENANPNYHRALLSFLNYEVIKKQLKEGFVPRIDYEKLNGEKVVLSVHRLDMSSENFNDTLWVFENIG